jgi:2-polyprenyl-6-methoxyphenol hydroxylase-like FAD-dependent oxidoreductase
MASALILDIPADEMVRTESSIPDGSNRAIVIGGSMAGLATARALSNHYRQVIVIERDRLGEAFENRRGVPQGKHAHGLLAGGLNALEAFFPGLSNELMSAGAIRARATREMHWCFEGGEHVRFESDLENILVSRPALEGTVRKRTREVSNIDIQDQCQVERLISSSAGDAVIGVETNVGPITAGLIVDASGRGSRSPRWLEAIGYLSPEEERIEVDIAYTTRRFRRVPQHMNGDLFASIPATPGNRTGGVIVAQEGGIWTVTMSSYGGSVPTELPGFIEHARALPARYIYDVICRAEPIGDASAARFPASVRRRYENMTRFPDGYLVLGDAICSFNPVYGQGMSVAALEAAELDRALQAGSADLAKRFFAQAARVVDAPWKIAAGSDLRMPQVAGTKTPMTRFFNWYVAALHAGAHRDSDMAEAFQNVANLLEPPETLLEPRLVARVLLSAWRRRMARNRSVRLEAAEKAAF